MHADRRRQMIGDPVFGGGEYLRSHVFGPTLQVGEQALSRGLVSAFGRDFDEEPAAIAISSDRSCRLVTPTVL